MLQYQTYYFLPDLPPHKETSLPELFISISDDLLSTKLKENSSELFQKV